MSENKTFNVALAIAGQRKLAEENKYPHFAPYTGKCYRCSKQIYEEYTKQFGERIITTEISVESASSSLVTGCPHCNASYCD